jgi:hypothetical protein
MKRFVIVVALTCALSSTALAGNIPTGGIVSPPPPPPAEETAQPGNIPSTDPTSPGEMPAVDLSIVLAILNLAF